MMTEGSLGSRIRERRKEIGMTQEELASMLYIQKSTICGYEHGQHIYDDRLSQLAKALMTTPNQLLGFKGTDSFAENAAVLLKEIKDEVMQHMMLAQIEAVVKAARSIQSDK